VDYALCVEESVDQMPAPMQQAERWRQVGLVVRHQNEHVFRRLVELAEAAAADALRDECIDETSKTA
jgi:hypothetical protein